MNTSNKPDTTTSMDTTAKPVAEAKAATAATEPAKKITQRDKESQVDETTPRFISRRVWPD